MTSSGGGAVDGGKRAKYQLPDPEMYKYYDKDLANSALEQLGLNDEDDKKHLQKMRRHSIYLDNQLLNHMQAVESARQFCSAKKMMRDIMVTRMEHLDSLMNELNKETDLDRSSTQPVSFEMFRIDERGPSGSNNHHHHP